MVLRGDCVAEEDLEDKANTRNVSLVDNSVVLEPRVEMEANSNSNQYDAFKESRDIKEPVGHENNGGIPEEGKLPLKDKAPDGGWGWMVVVGCALMHAVTGGTSRSYGVMYVPIQERFQSSAAVTAWIGGLCSALRFGLGPVTSALMNRFSARWVVIGGALMSTAGGVLMAPAPNGAFLLFSYSFMIGVGGSFCYVPGIVMVSQYFDRLRPIAIGISTAGGGLGTFLFPPLLEYSFQQFGYYGGMLLLAGLVLQNAIPGALYRPLNRPNSASAKQAETDERTSASFKMLKKGCANSLNFNISRYLDLTLLRNPRFVCYAGCLSLITMSYISAQMLVPPHAMDEGISRSKAAWLISVIGISDTLGRLSSGFFFSLTLIRPRRRHFYNVAILVSGATNLIWAFCEDYTCFVVVCAIHGLFNGIVVSQRATMLVDLLGVESVASSFGFTVFAQGAGLMAGPPIAGLIKDQTGSYTASFFFTGSCALLSALLLLLEYIVSARKRIAPPGEAGNATETESRSQEEKI